MRLSLGPPSWMRIVVVAVAPVLLAACGEGGSSIEPTPTVSVTPVPPVPTATPMPVPTASEEIEGEPEMEVEARCPDPYPQGAPHEPEPGEPIRLRPTGSPPALQAYHPMPFERDGALERVVRRSVGEERERFAVVVKNLADGRGALLAPDRKLYAASLFKVWVMLEAYHQESAGLLDFQESYVVSDYYGGEFGLNPGELAVCERVTLGEALAAMIGVSDNVAANMLLDRVGSGNVNAMLSGLGLAVSGVPVDGSLPTTAAEMALLLEAIARRSAIGEEASEEMLALLQTQGIDDRLPALLPAGTAVAHKTGNWASATHDAGIVFSPEATYVIVVLTDFGFDEDGATPIARLSRAVYDYYNEG